ncbi:MAG: hypothetical protein Q9P01_12700 [Anaerolineae bacterium]|nr:hypothetical protein [Anaerolineae bacterium]
MMNFFQSQLFERIMFTLVVVGLLLGIYSAYKVITISLTLNNNIAQQIRDSGEELEIQSTAEGRGLVAADIERRELVKERAQMTIAGGIGLALLGIGWLGYDFLNHRRKKSNVVQAAQV